MKDINKIVKSLNEKYDIVRSLDFTSNKSGDIIVAKVASILSTDKMCTPAQIAFLSKLENIGWKSNRLLKSSSKAALIAIIKSALEFPNIDFFIEKKEDVPLDITMKQYPNLMFSMEEKPLREGILGRTTELILHK